MDGLIRGGDVLEKVKDVPSIFYLSKWENEVAIINMEKVTGEYWRQETRSLVGSRL